VLRVVFSLAVVMGLLWLSYRVADRSRRSAPAGRGAQLTVVARQGLSQKSAAVLLESGGVRYLLGVTESSVTVIDQGPAPASAPAPVGPRHAVRDPAASRLGPFNVVKSTPGPRPAPADAVDRADLSGPTAGPSFDEAVLAARVWLDEAVVAAPLTSPDLQAGPEQAVTTTVTPAAPSGGRPAVTDQAAARSFLAADTWRLAARSVWGPRR